MRSWIHSKNIFKEESDGHTFSVNSGAAGLNFDRTYGEGPMVLTAVERVTEHGESCERTLFLYFEKEDLAKFLEVAIRHKMVKLPGYDDVSKALSLLQKALAAAGLKSD